MNDDHYHHSEAGGDEHPGTEATARGYAERGGHALLGGLSVAANGFRLVPSEIRFEAGVPGTLTFEIRDDDGGVVTGFEEIHGEPSHLILVRRDLTRFRHLHPELAADGTWTQEVAFPDSGVYRAFVDVLLNGRPTSLGVDLFVPGSFEPESRPTSTRESAAEGYAATLRPEEIRAGEPTTLEFEIRRADGRVARLDEYLEALGHLVALREGDLGYLHVHPEATDPESGLIRFHATFPTAGRYRLFLQAKPGGDLVTTTFDVHLEDG